jgi:hypothetical protein
VTSLVQSTRSATSSLITEVTGMSFSKTTAPPIAGTDGKFHTRITCHKCHQLEHYADRCPSTGNALPTFLPTSSSCTQVSPSFSTGFIYSQFNSIKTIPASWILLYSQSSESIFCNASLLTNIRASPYQLTLYTNGGRITSNSIGDFLFIGAVWYNESSMANILSLAHLRRHCRITMDTSTDHAIILHHPHGNILKFIEYNTGLYYYDTLSSTSQSSSPSSSLYSFVQTVASQKARFHRREVLAADTSRTLRQRLGNLSQTHFEAMLASNSIRNSPITIEDARRALIIYGYPPSLSSKTTSSKPVPVPSPSLHPDVPQLLADHQSVVLSIDIFCVERTYVFPHHLTETQIPYHLPHLR